MSATKTKPSLSGLMEQQKTTRRRKSKAAAVAVAEPPPPPPQVLPEDARAMQRKLIVRRFVSAFLSNNMDGAKAYRSIYPDHAQATSWTRASELLKEDDVRTELARQLRGIFDNADLDEDWVYRQWRAMANSSIFDYVEIDADGKVKFKLNPAELTREQQLNIRGLKFDKDTGRVVDIRLVDRQGAVNSVAQARKMFSVLQDTGLKDLVKDITERMQEAGKKVRTFDNETGEEIR